MTTDPSDKHEGTPDQEENTGRKNVIGGQGHLQIGQQLELVHRNLPA